MSGHTVGVTVWRGAASTVRLRADTDSKLASDIKLKVRGAQRASSPPILDVTNQTTNVSRCLLPQQGSNIEFDIHCGSAFDTNHRSVPQQGNRSVLPPRGAQAQWQIWPHLFPALSCRTFFFPIISSRFTPRTSHHSGQFGAPFSYDELVAAFSKCYESAPGADVVPYSVFKVR